MAGLSIAAGVRCLRRDVHGRCRSLPPTEAALGAWARSSIARVTGDLLPSCAAALVVAAAQNVAAAFEVRAPLQSEVDTA
jgi:hypothetical protein